LKWFAQLLQVAAKANKELLSMSSKEELLKQIEDMKQQINSVQEEIAKLKSNDSSFVEQQEQCCIKEAINYVYIVSEAHQYYEIYPVLYNTYEEAYQAAIEKYKEQLDEERAEFAEDGLAMASQVDVAENKETGKTYLYIEKGIYITIYRFKVNTPK
jgi:uncharacterized phage infection (PIP) family protein YhgE